MHKLLQKRSTQVIMVLLVLVIWIYNMTRIISIGTETEVVQANVGPELTDAEDFEEPVAHEFRYRGNFKDPFKPVIIRQQPPPTPPEQNEEVEEAEIRPEIQLYGIVEGLAVVQVLNNEVRFMEAGDQTEGISVQRIYTDSVEFRFNEELFTLKLE